MVLATLIYHPDYTMSSDKLLPEYFHDDFNKMLYISICELYKAKIKGIDFTSIDAILNEKYGKNESINPANCSEFLNMAKEFSRDSLEDYKLFMNRIVTGAYKRELIRKTEEIQRVCLKDGSEVLDVQEKMRELTMQLTEKFSVGNEDKEFSECIQEMWEQSRKKLLENNGQYGIPSKFTKLNEYCPFEPGEMILVAAQRKVGKSAYCLNECLDKLENGYKVLYMDTELTSQHFMNRIISLKAKVDNHQLKASNLSVAEKQRVSEAIEWFKNNKGLVHIFRANWTPEMIYSAVLYWRQKIGVNFVVFDYLKSTGEVGASEVYNSLGNKANFLKNNIAAEFDLPVLAAAQLNRSGDISDSYKLEMFASTILNLQKKTPKEIENDNQLGYGSLGSYKIFVKCNRNGNAMDDIRHEYIDVDFIGENFDFKNISNSPINHQNGTPYD